MPREPKERVQFNVRLDGRQQLVEAVKAYVANHRLTMSEFVATALENALLVGVKPNDSQQSAMVSQETVKEERIALLELEIAKVIQMAISLERLPELEEKVVSANELITNASRRLTQLEERLGK